MRARKVTHATHYGLQLFLCNNSRLPRQYHAVATPRNSLVTCLDCILAEPCTKDRRCTQTLRHIDAVMKKRLKHL